MAKNVVRCRTGTRADIVACFGKYPQDLDRPPRDGIQTVEYLLYNWSSSGAMVVFDFDPETGILQDWQISDWICGYCPHILASDGDWRLEGKNARRASREYSRRAVDTLLLPPGPEGSGIADTTGQLGTGNGVHRARCSSEWYRATLAGKWTWSCERRAVCLEGEMVRTELEPARLVAGCDGWMLRVGGPAAGSSDRPTRLCRSSGRSPRQSRAQIRVETQRLLRILEGRRSAPALSASGEVSARRGSRSPEGRRRKPQRGVERQDKLAAVARFNPHPLDWNAWTLDRPFLVPTSSRARLTAPTYNRRWTLAGLARDAEHYQVHASNC